MHLFCGALKNLWLEFYNNYVIGLDDRTKVIVGFAFVVLSMFVFVMCTKGHSKSEMVNSWFLFWLSMGLLLAGLYYLLFA